MKHKIAAQLYTVRELLEADFPGVLKEIKEMGYAAVELAGMHGHDPREIASVLRELDLQVAGMHVSLESFRKELSRVLEEAEIFQTKNLILPYLEEEDRTVESYTAIKAEFNALAEELKNQGYRICYHHHDFEFETKIEGKSALEYLLEPTQDNLILAELDVYWLEKSGKEILPFLERYANRIPNIHLKDMAKGKDKSFAEVGTGIIAFEPILQWGEKNGVEWYVVEQDICAGNPLDSLRTSIKYLHYLIDQQN
ncbi:sugar phosphate isomerase/epimerase family protein [Sutcliffiella deserti]|uniref:sugar phosphate isomerase/epimerase family protein n=1 Tax=Sutcliffiella deserti TaxID=2875501 RepID=UPI001CC0AC14|nr:sugar phosphate isomerase/epimerase [Sutcliffiella deserti]